MKHAEIEAYLRELGQNWREDSSNRNLTFTRNRIRHELLPLLEGWNPRMREHLAQMAALAATKKHGGKPHWLRSPRRPCCRGVLFAEAAALPVQASIPAWPSK